jgi:hypothetical protein
MKRSAASRRTKTSSASPSGKVRESESLTKAYTSILKEPRGAGFGAATPLALGV